MRRKISENEFGEKDYFLWGDLKGNELLFSFCHRRNTHTYTVKKGSGYEPGSKSEIVWQGTSLADACEEFNNLP